MQCARRGILGDDNVYIYIHARVHAVKGVRAAADVDEGQAEEEGERAVVDNEGH